MKPQIRDAVIAAAALTAAAGAARAADYVTIPLEASVDAPADAAWKKIGGYCDIGTWLKTSCVITSGKADDVGAVRRIADRVDEVLVSRTAWSYTYAQPKSPIDYHGTVEIRPDGPKKSTILYTLIYDAAALPAGADKAKDVAGRTAQFTRVINTMKGIAEAK
jgi:polyketide cyclase/dehydrase/lipid transport protein